MTKLLAVMVAFATAGAISPRLGDAITMKLSQLSIRMGAATVIDPTGQPMGMNMDPVMVQINCLLLAGLLVMVMALARKMKV